MATVTPVVPTAAGTTFAYAAASGGGDSIAVGTTAGRKVVFFVKNGDASSITVTLAGAVNCSLGSTHNVVITVPGTTEKEIVVPAHTINQTTGNVAVTYSAVTSVTVAASAPNG
jgi:hypothetical protein